MSKKNRVTSLDFGIWLCIVGGTESVRGFPTECAGYVWHIKGDNAKCQTLKERQLWLWSLFYLFYLFPRSGIWAIQPLGSFLIICFHLPVGYMVKIKYPDLFNDCSIGSWKCWLFESITFFGILFHSSTTLCETLYFLTFVLQFFLYNFLLWPLVVVWLKGRICSYCTLSILLIWK